MSLSFRPMHPTRQDAELVLGFRNDPDALPFFFHTTPKTADAFHEEYLATYCSTSPLPGSIVLLEGVPAGYVRFEPYDLPERKGKAVGIGVVLGPEARDRGLGPAVLRKAAKSITSQGVDVVVAEIKQDNPRSIRAFEKAGFLFHDAMTKHLPDMDEDSPIFRFTYVPRTAEPSTRNKVFIIAEAGSNWRVGSPERDLEMARALIHHAKEAGADAVKFQTYRAQDVYVANAGQSEYLKDSGIKKDIVDIFEDLSMPYEMLPALAEICAEADIQFMSTPFSVQDAQYIDPHVQVHKLASYEISHLRLIEELAATGKPLVMSTGGASRDDIEWAIGHFHASGGTDLTLMQCTAKYPAPLSSLNLRVIRSLADDYGVPIGLSDHSRDPVTGPVGAVALGATVIEKHFTLHNSLPGPDHSFAVTSAELATMVRAIRDMEEALGVTDKMVQDEEQELKSFAQRGIQAIADIGQGDAMQEGVNIDILRPGQQRKGIHPKFLPEINSRKATRDIPLGDGIQEGDWDS